MNLREYFEKAEESDLYLASFRVDKVLGLTGSGKCPVEMRSRD